MKKQPGKFENGISFIVSLLIAFPICAVIWVSMKIVWPVLRFCAKAARSLLRKAMTKSNVVKPTSQLPTPAIFKGAPNLARARSVRF